MEIERDRTRGLHNEKTQLTKEEGGRRSLICFRRGGGPRLRIRKEGFLGGRQALPFTIPQLGGGKNMKKEGWGSLAAGHFNHRRSEVQTPEVKKPNHFFL